MLTVQKFNGGNPFFQHLIPIICHWQTKFVFGGYCIFLSAHSLVHKKYLAQMFKTEWNVIYVWCVLYNPW